MALEIGKFWRGKHGRLKIVAVIAIIIIFVLFVFFVDNETTSNVPESQKNAIKPTGNNAQEIEKIITGYKITNNNRLISPTVEPPKIVKKGCKANSTPIININQKIVNDHDFDNKGNNWAIDTYEHNLKIWKQPENSYTFCAEQNLVGIFKVISGKTSPGNKASILTGNEDGILIGSSRIIIIGLLKNEPVWPVTGTVEEANYQCVFDNNCSKSDSSSWSAKYFDNIAWGYPKTDWFNWTYKNGNYVWINSSEGNYGDVL